MTISNLSIDDSAPQIKLLLLCYLKRESTLTANAQLNDLDQSFLIHHSRFEVLIYSFFIQASFITRRKKLLGHLQR